MGSWPSAASARFGSSNYCVLLCWILSFLGLVIGKKTLDGTTLARFFLTFRFITNGLM